MPIPGHGHGHRSKAKGAAGEKKKEGERWLKDFLEEERADEEKVKEVVSSVEKESSKSTESKPTKKKITKQEFFSRKLLMKNGKKEDKTDSSSSSSSSGSDVDVSKEDDLDTQEDPSHVGYALLPHGLRNPLYVSAGDAISQETAKKLVEALCGSYRIPLPVRLADLKSRKKVARVKEEQAAINAEINAELEATDATIEALGTKLEA